MHMALFGLMNSNDHSEQVSARLVLQDCSLPSDIQQVSHVTVATTAKQCNLSSIQQPLVIIDFLVGFIYLFLILKRNEAERPLSCD